MTKMKDNYTIEDILVEVKKYLEPSDLITRSFNYAINLYPEIDTKKILSVASILTTLQADEETIAASFLHHLFDKDLVSFQELEKNFESQKQKRGDRLDPPFLFLVLYTEKRYLLLCFHLLCRQH